MKEKLHEECGVFGIYDNDNLDVVTSTYLALYALQHRGQESCGIAVNDDGVIRSYRDLGLVTDVFKPQVLEKLGAGKMAIGHCLYGTAESDKRENAQPMTIRHVKGQMAIANNGVVLNAYELRQKLELQGAIFHSTSDAELIAHMITRERLTAGSIEEAICNAMDKLYGVYSMLVMSPKKLIGVRDPLGMRPLSIGKCENSYVLASETAALDSMGAHFVRDVKPGEIVIIDENGLRSIEKHCGKKSHLCVFEFVYFARPDSVIEGTSVHLARQKMGEFLAKEHPVEADLVMGVPDSGNDAALGYAHASGIPYRIGQAQRHRRHRPGKADCAGGRLHRPGHHFRPHRGHAAGSRGQRSAYAHFLPALPLSLLLRHRHRLAGAADCQQHDHSRDRQEDRGGFPGLPQPPEHRQGGGKLRLPVLHRLLQRRISPECGKRWQGLQV